MKKYILMMIALFGITAAASAQKVYIAPSKSAIAYHKSKDCSYLKNSVNVTSVTTADAKDMGRHACVRCYPEKAKETMMAAVAATVAKINALRLRRLRSTKRVSYNESFGDILSQSVPTPPTSRYAGTSFSVRNAAY